MRDEFSKTTRLKLALQANYRCAFTMCGRATSGPSDESPTAVAYIGMAAHIHAASPGGARFRADMRSEERKDIANGVWMCRNHGTLIDEDEHTYTADSVREMKRVHADRIAAELTGCTYAQPIGDLFAIGPRVIVIGELAGVDASRWKLRVFHFVTGELATLVELSERFSEMDSSEQYILANCLGDGRMLIEPPSIERSADDLIVACAVAPAFPRTDADSLPGDLALGADHDIFAENGAIAIVSGLDALPQRIQTNLSMQLGENHFDKFAGSRLTNYVELFRDSVWFANLLKLEVIRHASIPRRDQLLKTDHTRLASIKSVRSVNLVGPGPKDNWLLFQFVLDVQGVGEWTRTIPIFIPSPS